MCLAFGAGGAVGVLVGFEEHRGDADRPRGARQHRANLALARPSGRLAAGLLHSMGGVDHDRIAGRAP